MTLTRFLLLAGACFLFTGSLAGQGLAQGPAGSLEIQIASPGQGEIFYTAPDGVITSVPISGRVVSYDTPIDLTTVELTLTFIDDTGARAEIHVPVGVDGYFHVWATINAHGLLPILDDHLNDLCLRCHERGALAVPSGVSRLLVHARTPAGLTGSAIRNIRLDRGEFRALEVQVEGLPDAGPAAQVVASTTVYEWRPRAFFASVIDGQARVNVEGLSYASLSYEVKLTPLVIDFTRYEAEPQMLTLPAGGDPPRVTLVASPVRGVITGRVVTAGSRSGIGGARILAVDLQTGMSHTATTDKDGSFALEDLPVSEHVLLAQSSAGVHLPVRHDLREDVAPEVTVHLVPGGPDALVGRVTLEGEPLPFAQAAVDGLLTAQADPLTGAFALAAVPEDEAVEVTITAAGCYSVQQTVNERDLGIVELALHPATTVLEQGGSQLYLPAETRASHSGREVQLEQGVLWVVGRTAGPGLTILAGDYRLSGEGASYAVEALGGALPRLYVRAGTVTAMRGEEPPLSVSAGETLTLTGDSARPIELAAGAGPLLRTVGGGAGRFEVRPPLADRVTAALWLVLQGVAQVLMLGAYAITFLGFPLLIVGGIIMWVRRH